MQTRKTTAAGQFDASLATASTHDNVQRVLPVNTTTSDSLPGGVTSINSLALIDGAATATSLTYSGTGAITIDSGGLLIAGIAESTSATPPPLAVTLNGFSKIDFGNQEGVFTVNLETLFKAASVTTAISNVGTVQDNVELDGSNGLTKGGKGTLSVNVAANYTGTTTVSGGTLLANGTNLLPTSTVVDVNADSFLQVASGNSQQIAGLFGDGFVQNGGTGSPATVVINTVSPTSNTFTGIIEDNGLGQTALTIQGSGIQYSSGASTYSGGTSITSGTLMADNAGGSATGSGPVNVTGGTLGGTGKITGAVTVSGGAALLAGHSSTSDTLTLAGGVTMNDTSNVQLIIGAGGTHSTLALMSSASSFNGTVMLSFVDLGATTGMYSNIFTGLLADPSSHLVLDPKYTGTFSYDSGNLSLDLTAVPEPTSLSLIAVAGIGFMKRRRRQQVLQVGMT